MNDVKAIATAAQRYFRIFKVPHDQATRDFLGRSRSDAVRVGSGSYEYHSQGSGPTVLLVHGYNSNLGSMIPIAKDLIEQGFKAVLFDAPAHGQASGSQTTHVEVRDVIRKIAEGLGSVDAVIWHSLGGVWALCAWGQALCPWGQALRARRLISIAAPSSYGFLVRKFAELHQLEAGVVEGLSKQLERRFGENIWVEASPREILGTIDVPGLVIHGENDDFVPPTEAEQLVASWRGARAERVAGVGHVDALSSPRVRQLITTYLADLQ